MWWCMGNAPTIALRRSHRSRGFFIDKLLPVPSPSYQPFNQHLASPPAPLCTFLRSTMADKLRAQQQLEALQARYIGIGSADTTKHEWTSNIARDSLSSYIGHPPLLQYMSIGLGQPREKTRVQLLERMVRPVGPPPEVSGRSPL